MSYVDPIEEMREKRKKQKQGAIDKLNTLIKNKIQLKRPVFFVPGWTDESCACWIKSERNNICIKDWFDKICSNPEDSRYINFEKETSQCKSFLDFGEVLKNKVWDYIGKDKEFDIVGHSMGGLDIRAALIAEKALLNVRNCLTVATPHQGDNFGGMNTWLRNTPFIRSLVNKIMPEKPYQILQGMALDPDYEQIKFINTPENKTLFLQMVEKLCQFKGTMDFTVKGSAYINETGINGQLCKDKIVPVEIDGADHVGKIGITQDPRTVLTIVMILLGLKREDSKENHGIFIGGMQS